MSDPTTDSDKVRIQSPFQDTQSSNSIPDPEQEAGQVTTVPASVPVLAAA